jgi:hypothetical protein
LEQQLDDAALRHSPDASIQETREMLDFARYFFVAVVTIGTCTAAASAGSTSVRAAAALLGGVLGLRIGAWIASVLRPLLHLSPPRASSRARQHTSWFEVRSLGR